MVVIVAAIAGWATVHLLDRGTRPRVAVEPAAVATVPVPQPTVAAVATAAPRATASPAAPLPTTGDIPAPDDAESAIIERDLGMLAQALVRDQRIEDNVMPRVNDILDIPGPTEYRRVPDFWEPALAGDAGAKP